MRHPDRDERGGRDRSPAVRGGRDGRQRVADSPGLRPGRTGRNRHLPHPGGLSRGPQRAGRGAAARPGPDGPRFSGPPTRTIWPATGPTALPWGGTLPSCGPAAPWRAGPWRWGTTSPWWSPIRTAPPRRSPPARSPCGASAATCDRTLVLSPAPCYNSIIIPLLRRRRTGPRERSRPS